MNTPNTREYSKQREKDLEAWLQALTLTIKASVKCCPNCIRFDNVREVCDVANKTPPAKVIAFGCEMFNGIPPF